MEKVLPAVLLPQCWTATQQPPRTMKTSYRTEVIFLMDLIDLFLKVCWQSDR